MKNFAKILVFIVALALVFGAIGVNTFAVNDTSDGITLYLKPNSNWTQSNARFAVYTWDGGDRWFNMTSAGDGYYTVTIPAGISNIIFCRMNPSATANNWNNKWNQTADLKVQTNGNNCYTVKAGTWDKGGGTWSKFTCAHTNVAGSEVVLSAPTCTESGLTQYTCSKCGDYTVVTEPKGHTYSNRKCTVCGAMAPYTVAGANSSNAASIFGTAWDTTNTANDMTYDEATGAYTKVYTNVPAGTYKFKCAQDHAWNTAYPSSDKSVKVSYSGSTLTITLKGTTVTASVVAPPVLIGTNGYHSIQDAVNAAKNGNVIKLNSNLELAWDGTTMVDGQYAAYVCVAGKSVTIDLNGKTLTGNTDTVGSTLFAAFAADEGGSLILKDSRGTGKVIVNGEAKAYSLIMAYEEGTAITINGGTYSLANASSSLIYAGGGNDLITVNGGNFTLGNVGTGVNGSPWIVNTLGQNNSHVNINNGTFNADVNHQFWAHEVVVPTNKAVAANGDGTWTLVDAQAYVTENVDGYDRNVGYATLAEAFAAVKEGETLTILAGTYTTNISVNKDITVAGETDADGNNLVNINGKLNVTANGATVKNLNVNNGSSTAGYVGGKDILIEGCSVVGGNGFRYCYTSGVVTFKDSVITGSVYGIHFDGNAGGEIVIDGCTITGWTSFAGTINKVSMLDTSFEVGNYNYIRLYQTEVVLEGCNFNENMKIDLAASSATVTVNDCTLENGKADYLFSDSDIKNFDITVDGEELKVLYIQVNGENRYGTYADAMSTVVDGDEVTILRAGTYKLLVAGKDITVTGGVDGVVFEGMGAYNMGSANVTFNNVTFNWTNENYKGLQHSGNLVYNNCTINGQVSLYGQSDIFNECTFNQTSADAYNVWTYGSKNVEFNKCTFNSAGKAVLVYSESDKHFINLSITETTFNASELVKGKAAIEIDTSLTAGANISIDAATTATGFDAGNVSGNSLWNNKKGNDEEKNNDIIINVAGEEVLAPLPYVVLIGETKYTNIYAALNAAKTGDTITLNSDVLLTEALALNGKNVTLNLNGKTLTYGGAATFALRAAGAMITVTGNATLVIDGQGTVLSNGAAFSIEEGSEVVILNGTFDFDVTEYLADGLRIAESPKADGTVLYGVVSNSEKTYIGENGNWWVGEYDTGVRAAAKVEIREVDGVNYWFINDVNTSYVADPTDAITPEIKIIDGVWHIDLKDGNGFQSTSVVAAGVDGNGIVSIEKTAVDGNIDTYTITYADGTTTIFFVTNGIDGSEGDQGEDGLKGNDGPKGDRGEPGANGADNNWLVNYILIASISAIVLSAGVVLALNYKRLNWWN